MWLFHGCDPSLTFLTANSNSRDSGNRTGATAAAGLRPADANETMLAALLVATHGAAMECYRLGMSLDQELEGRRESLSRANELARSCAALMAAIDRHRGRDGERRA
jgi:hypothetical protein